MFPYFLSNYLDDLAGAEAPSEADQAMSTLLVLLQKLRLQESENKR